MFDSDRDELFESMSLAGIETAIIPGVNPEGWAKQLQVAKQYSCPYGLGIHPWFCEDEPQRALEQLSEQVNACIHDPYLVAIGECGLDKIRKDNWQGQIIALEAQLSMARQLDLPVILHVVKAHSEMLAILKRYSLPRGGVIHGFYGSYEIANEYIKLGYKLGIGGLILNASAKKLKTCVAQLPLDSMLIETDSPAMTPQNSADSRNTPLILQSIIAEIANLHKKSSVLITEHTFRNSMQLFDLKLILI
ncbi:hydrolase, TatD family [Shewanella violacea DSS12]|uniref:Hydrolase, TatD family n=1 Tax=Shewanella violacea (strain JCM 10179 / CIP 106290 / LMG 19151 / DSS12) TaxID=637905 RepID=D4ZB57_SHEVD|nr:hydrolase, TatD family [Shewanella violacea DSS12]